MLYISDLGYVSSLTPANIINCQGCETVSVPAITNESTILIFPNPFTSSTTLTFNKQQKNTTIKITDVLGKEIKKGEMERGVYFVQITDENKHRVNRKIVIQ